MGKRIFFATLLVANLIFPRLSYAEPVFISIPELIQQSDLVISGEVIKIEQTNETAKIIGSHEGKISYATIRIDKVLKGKTESSSIIVEFIELKQDLEADVQDAQFALGDKGTAYLRKLPSGRYKALGGWAKGWHDGQGKK